VPGFEGNRISEKIDRKKTLEKLKGKWLAAEADSPEKSRLEVLMKTVASYEHDPALVRVLHPGEEAEGRYKGSIDRIVHHLGKAVRVKHRRRFGLPDGRVWTLSYEKRDWNDRYDPDVAINKWSGRYNEMVRRQPATEDQRKAQKGVGEQIDWMEHDRQYPLDFEDPEGFFDPVDIHREIELSDENYRTGYEDRFS
jgi:hypothetical protein